jgi:hypothetical protein
MKSSMVWFGAALLAALLFTGTGVRADGIPWGYGAISPPDIAASSSPLSSIQVIGSSGNPTGNSGIIIYNMTTTSFNDGVSQPPDSFNNVKFDLAINLTDIKALGAAVGVTTKTSGVVNFSGLFNATNATAQSFLPGVTTWSLVPGNGSETTANVILGSDDPTVGWRNYKIDITSFTAPGQPGGAPGSIQAVVTINPSDAPGGSGEGPPTNGTPEPTSLLLAGLGLPLVVLVRRRLKKSEEA